MITAPHSLDQILDLYERGLYLQAYTISQGLGPLERWEGTPGRLLAGRLAVQLGGRRLSHWLHRRAWRDDPTHPEACYYRARVRLERSGPLAAWEFLRRLGEMRDAPPEVRGSWLALCATVAAHLRDFEAADAWIAEAERIAPGDPWVAVEQASILEAEDRYEEALAAARRSLEMKPWFRPGVQATAHALQLQRRDEEAAALLADAAERIESAAVLAQLTLAQTELGRWAEARQSLDRFEALSPLMDKEMAQWLAGRRSDVAYHEGDLEQAIHFARLADDPFHKEIAERLAAAGRGSPSEGVEEADISPNAATHLPSSVLLPVGFVRQHHMTCAPATLSAISRFWSMPADHLSVVEEICYDGTADHSERHWAEQHGWAAREFTVTWESAVALLDRGIPFTLTTAEPANAHLQAVIGYDRRRRTLLIRDPYERHYGEFLADQVLEMLRSTGPRGMALVPREQSALLDGLDLPDAPLYDQYHHLQRALSRHDRPEAQTLYEALLETSPDHRLTLQARRSLAAYDSDMTGLLACAERLLELYPDDGGLLLLKLFCLRHLARREERIELLRSACGRKGCHPVFRQQYAQELAPDAREHATALHLLRRALRVRPGDGASVFLLARMLWDQRRFEEALRLFRIAACLDDKNEMVSQGYFFASRHLKQTNATIQFLKNRYQRFGSRSSQPGRTLFWALSEMNRTPEAFRVLEDALHLRPDDGELLLFATEAHSRHGSLDRAAALLDAAEGKSRRTEWLRTAAELALHRGDLAAALALRRQVVGAEPLDVDGHRAVAQLIAETDSRAAALDYLSEVVARFPHHYRLHQLQIEWLREEEPEKYEAAIRHLIHINPVDAWARQELALTLGQQQRFDEALAESETAERLDPDSPNRLCVHGQVCGMAGRLEEARQAYRQAIQLSADMGYAIWALVEACDSPAERRQALAFVEGELVRQTIFGDGLLAFRDQARQSLEPEELLATLRKALRERPDLWHAWSAIIGQLIDMDRLDEAHSLARQATARFPLLPQLWLDLAKVAEARADRAAELEALQHGLRISPGWGPAVVQLASLYERTGEFDRAKTLLEQSVARTPLDPRCHGWLAQILWRLKEKEAALGHVERALELEPGYMWAWNVLRGWSKELEPTPAGEGRAVAFARHLTVRRAGEARSWMMLAQVLTGEDALPERLAAVERAISLNPRLTEAYERKAELLVEAGRFEEALAACRPEPWRDAPPSPLRARAARVEAERGNVREAIAQMRTVVADDPHFYRGWAELAHWYDESGAGAEYLEAAQKMAHLEPQNPQAVGLLADARMRTGDRRGAKTAFRRAFDLAPDYAFAGMSLVDAQMEDAELDEAVQTLARLRTHVGGEWVMAREVQLAARRNDQRTALHCLRDLCVARASDPWPYHAAASAMTKAGWSAPMEQIFDEVLERPDVNPRVGELWVRSRIARSDWKCESRLEVLRARGAVGLEATAAYLELLAEAGRAPAFFRYLNKHAGPLRRETVTWAAVGSALLTLKALRRTALWLADWRERPDAEPWMLVPLVVSLRAAGRDAEAAAASQSAVEAHDRGDRIACHAVWLATDHALSGDWQKAANYLASSDPASLNRYYRFLHALAQASVEVQTAGLDMRRQTFDEARRRLEAAAPLPADWHCPALRRVHRLLVLRMARDMGGTAAKLWAWMRLGAIELGFSGGS